MTKNLGNKYRSKASARSSDKTRAGVPDKKPLRHDGKEEDWEIVFDFLANDCYDPQADEYDWPAIKGFVKDLIDQAIDQTLTNYKKKIFKIIEEELKPLLTEHDLDHVMVILQKAVKND